MLDISGPARLQSALGRNTRMTFDINLGLFGGFWLAGVASAVLAIWWSLFAARGRILTAAILSLSALTIGFLGSTHFHLTWTAWANGQLQYHYDTRWFFIAPLVLGVFALTCTVRKKVRASQLAQPRCSEPSDGARIDNRGSVAPGH
jgi:hypothetical protein